MRFVLITLTNDQSFGARLTQGYPKHLPRGIMKILRYFRIFLKTSGFLVLKDPIPEDQVFVYNTYFQIRKLTFIFL